MSRNDTFLLWFLRELEIKDRDKTSQKTELSRSLCYVYFQACIHKRRKQKNRRVTQQYDNGDSGHQANPFSHKEISSIFTGHEVAQATRATAVWSPLSPGSRFIHQAAKLDSLFTLQIESDVTVVENRYDIQWKFSNNHFNNYWFVWKS
jgi:hypothetical protein